MSTIEIAAVAILLAKKSRVSGTLWNEQIIRVPSKKNTTVSVQITNIISSLKDYQLQIMTVNAESSVLFINDAFYTRTDN